MYLVYTRYIPDIYFGVYVGIYQVYTRYIPGLEITRYIPGIYLVYTSYIADVGLYPFSCPTSIPLAATKSELGDLRSETLMIQGEPTV